VSGFLPLDIARCDAGAYRPWEGALVDGRPARLVPIIRDGQTREFLWVPARPFGPQGDRRPVIYDAAMAYSWAPEFGAYIPWKPTPAAKRTAAFSNWVVGFVVTSVWITGVISAFVVGFFICAVVAYATATQEPYETASRFNYPAGIAAWITWAVLMFLVARLLSRRIRGGGALPR